MESLISFPLKKTYEIDLTKYLKAAILAQYDNVDEKSKDNLEVLNRMRVDATSGGIERSISKKSFEWLKEHKINRYYDQLVLLSNKLPQANVPFKWNDAFEKGGLFSSGTRSLSFEKVCILFNIGALFNNVGAYYGKYGADLYSTSVILFQRAAGIYQALKHITSTSSDGHELTFDLQSELLNLLQHLALAQAQESFYRAFETYDSRRKCSEVAAQCAELYGEVEKQIQSINFKDKLFLPDWFEIVHMKHHAFKGIAQYYQAIVAKDCCSFGEAVTRFKIALGLLKAAEYKKSFSLLGKISEIYENAGLYLEELEHDDRIDDDIIPVSDCEPMPLNPEALLAIATEMSSLFFPNEPDLFANLSPQTLSGTLASLNLHAAEDTQGNQVPQSIQEKAKTMREKGGMEEIER